MSDLPPSWERVSFEVAFAIVGDEGRRIKQSDYLPTGMIPVVDQGEGLIGGFTDDERLANRGPLPLIVFGDHTRRFKFVDFRFAVGAQGTKLLCPLPGLSSKFLYYQMLSLRLPDRGYGRHFALLRGVKLGIAPRPEQDRIVCAIEENLSRLEAAESSVERARQQLERLRAAAVDEAMRNLGETQECSGEEVFGYITSGSRGWAKYYAPSGSLFIRVGNVPRTGIRLDLSDVQLVSPPDGAEGRRTRVEPGDLLITITADIGRVAVCPPGLGAAYINQHVALARPRDGLDSEYLAWFVASSPGQRQLRGLQRGATKLGLGLDDIRAIRIPVPALTRQREIASQLSNLRERLGVLEADLEQLRRRSAALRRSVLDASFTGRLVAQDPSDEPASVLLERIQEERDAASPAKQARKAKVS